MAIYDDPSSLGGGVPDWFAAMMGIPGVGSGLLQPPTGPGTEAVTRLAQMIPPGERITKIEDAGAELPLPRSGATGPGRASVLPPGAPRAEDFVRPPAGASPGAPAAAYAPEGGGVAGTTPPRVPTPAPPFTGGPLPTGTPPGSPVPPPPAVVLPPTPTTVAAAAGVPPAGGAPFDFGGRFKGVEERPDALPTPAGGRPPAPAPATPVVPPPATAPPVTVRMPPGGLGARTEDPFAKPVPAPAVTGPWETLKRIFGGGGSDTGGGGGGKGEPVSPPKEAAKKEPPAPAPKKDEGKPPVPAVLPGVPGAPGTIGPDSTLARLGRGETVPRLGEEPAPAPVPVVAAPYVAPRTEAPPTAPGGAPYSGLEAKKVEKGQLNLADVMRGIQMMKPPEAQKVASPNAPAIKAIHSDIPALLTALGVQKPGRVSIAPPLPGLATPQGLPLVLRQALGLR